MSPVQNDWDRFEQREDPEQEPVLVAQLRSAFDMAERLHAQFDGWRVLPSTSIHGDDLASPYEPMSHQLSTAMGVAFDNLRTIRLALDSGSLPVFAHFGLIRNALEAVGVALWALGPTSRDVRVLRGLQLTLEGRKDIRSLEMAMNGVVGAAARLPDDDPVRRRLEEIRDARPGLVGRSLEVPTITKRLTEAEEYASSNDVFTLLFAWKLTSGIAHGRRSTMLALLDREVTERHAGGGSIYMTSSFASVTGLYKVALRNLMQLLVLVLDRSGTPIDRTQFQI